MSGGKYSYILQAIPDVFKGATVAYRNRAGNASETTFTAKTAGDVYVITSNKKSASQHTYYLSASAADMLEEQGFEEITKYTGIKNFLEPKWKLQPAVIRYNVYKKHLNAGETFKAARVTAVISKTPATITADVNNAVKAHYANGDVTVSVKTGKPLDGGKLIICTYSGEDLVDTKFADISPNVTDYTEKFTAKEKPDTVKVFVWKGFDSMIPLSKDTIVNSESLLY